MATNHFERHGVTPPTVYNQQFFVVCGPISEETGPLALTRKLWREHSLSVSVVGVFALFLLGSWWGAVDYPGAVALLIWRCELLAGILSLLTVFLLLTFRRWSQERAQRIIARRGSSEPGSILLCTPPPLSDEVPLPAQPEFSVTIEHWKSHEPMPLSEASMRIEQLPDEFLAPDALVLNFEMRNAG